MKLHRIHDQQVKPLFGLTDKDKWPDAGMHERPIPLRFVLPRDTAQLPGNTPTGVIAWAWVRALPPVRRGFRLRAMCQCPQCDKTMALGRIVQHFNHVHGAVTS